MFKRPFIMVLEGDANTDDKYCIARQRFFVWSYLDISSSSNRKPTWFKANPRQASYCRLDNMSGARLRLLDLNRDPMIVTLWRKYFVQAGRPLTDLDRAQERLEGNG
jgi:hypothetical protein